MRQKAAAAPYILWMLIFILVPLALVVMYAVTTPDGQFTISYISQVGEYAPVSVSYTHLDVYKRQDQSLLCSSGGYLMGRGKTV